jgi:hypothetical protein
MATSQLPTAPAQPDICPAGRVEVAGTVLSTKITPDRGFGIGRKMLVELENGARVYGNAPLGIDQGNEIKMKATIEIDPKDRSFGYFSRARFLSNERPQVVEQSHAAVGEKERWYQKL